MAHPFEVRPTDFSEQAVEQLVLFHLKKMYETSPADGVFAFGLEALREPDISGFAAWRGDELVGIGAFKSFDTYAEVKSMRTSPEAAGLGVGTAILSVIEQSARELGLSALKLETGPPPHFLAANRFYEKHGFTVCGPFGAYKENAHSVFYEKAF
ncbi:GNAT family N-acetyltransferase [Erythrobacter sp. HA6-11]